MFHNLRSIPFAILSVMLVLPADARAEDVWASPYPEQKSWPQVQEREKDWNFSAGGGVMYGPTYEGSDKYVVMPVPDVSVEYKDGLFFANIWDGIGSYPLQGENYKVGASVGFAPGRDEGDDKKNLRGMGDIDMGATANLMGEYDIGPVKFSGKVSRGNEDYGTTASVEAGTMVPVTENIMLVGLVGPTWADDDHMASRFGVSSRQSARSGYQRYDAESGFKSVGLTLGAFYSITDNWDAKFMVKADQLLGDAADSPITKDDFQPSAIVTTSYKF